MHARAPAVVSIQETKSWDVPNLTLPGYVCYGSEFGLAALLVSFAKLWDHGDSLRDHSADGRVRSRFGQGRACFSSTLRKRCKKSFTSLATSMWCWGRCVPTTTTLRSSMRCTAFCAGKQGYDHDLGGYKKSVQHLRRVPKAAGQNGPREPNAHFRWNSALSVATIPRKDPQEREEK